MASYNIHLAVAKRYAEKQGNIHDLHEFYKGALAPDLAPDKKISHYTGIQDKAHLVLHLENKVRLNKYLEQNNINADYNKGEFLHLVTDYLFYNYFFKKEQLENMTYDEFFLSLYYSYDYINEHLLEKYQIDYSKIVDKTDGSIDKHRADVEQFKGKKSILPIDKLDEFIEEVSDIDLEKYKEKIHSYGKNILP